MSKFYACLKAELLKLMLRKKYFVFMIIDVAICLLVTLVSELLKRLAGGQGLSFMLNMPMVVLPVATQVILPLVAIMACGDLFAHEYQSRSVRAQLMRPVSRFKIYIAKVAAALIVCAMIMGVTYVATALCMIVSGGGAKGLLYALGAYAVDVIPLFIVILMASFVNQFTKGSTSAMFLCIIIYVPAKVAGMFVPVIDSLLFTSYLQWHRLWLGATLPVYALITKSLLLAGYGLVFLSGGYLKFLNHEG